MQTLFWLAFQQSNTKMRIDLRLQYERWKHISHCLIRIHKNYDLLLRHNLHIITILRWPPCSARKFRLFGMIYWSPTPRSATANQVFYLRMWWWWKTQHQWSATAVVLADTAETTRIRCIDLLFSFLSLIWII